MTGDVRIYIHVVSYCTHITHHITTAAATYHFKQLTLEIHRYTILKASYPKNQTDVKACCEELSSRGNRLLLKLMDSNPIHRPTANDALTWISSSSSSTLSSSISPSLPPGLKGFPSSSSSKKPRQRHKTPPRSALKAMRKTTFNDNAFIDEKNGNENDEGMVCFVQ